MTTRSFIDRLRRYLRELRTANGANVTITFALATIPIVGFVGAAVDYSHANSVKTAMQAAVDTTALMLSKDAPTLTNSQLQTKALDYFKALFHRPEVTNLEVDATYSTDNGPLVVVSAHSDVKTNFMGIMGFSQLKVGTASQVKWGNTRLRVALVLDNTGSMSEAGKMSALKTATKNLITQLKSTVVTNGDVYVSIVPFVKDVNVGASNYQADWIYWDDAAHTDKFSWDAQNGSCTKSASTRSSCLTKGTCTGANYNSKNNCINHGGTWTPATWTPDDHKTWTGCVMDRGASLAPSNLNTDTNVAAADPTKPDTLFPAEQYSSCPQAVLPLSYDWAAMTTLINNMSPAGNTNQAIGLAQGWLSLVGGGPYPDPPPMDTNYKYSQVIILLTDGLNTQDRWYSDQASIDAREKITCDNVNQAKITLYTVQVNTGGDPTSTLLQNCAGSPGKYPDKDKFFLLTSANQIVTTFQQIATNLSNLRIAQ
jgi:Flp pilus assembly protein TadG